MSISPAIRLPWLTEELCFPDPETALAEPNGLLAAGGDLSSERLLLAYRNGIFPWYSDGDPILWWSPDPRTVIFPGKLHISRSLAKFLRRKPFRFTHNTAFTQVIDACRQPRKTQHGTWITNEMKVAYIELYRLGFAHSIECWQGQHLVGGIYGIILGKCFFGESMFSRADNASKAVMVKLDRILQENHFALLDCQVSSSHLLSMGALEIPRREFLYMLHQNTDIKTTESMFNMKEIRDSL